MMLAANQESLPPIGFIGGGNMATAIIGGLLAKQLYTPNQIYVNDVTTSQLTLLSEKYGVNTTTDLPFLLSHARIIFLAVKPHIVSSLLQDNADSFDPQKHIVISICAGVECSTIESLFQQSAPDRRISVLRVMPNTPSLVGVGASGVCIGRYTHPQHLVYATQIMSSVGVVKVVPESSMDAITGLSGSGPAYVFTMIESLTMGGVLAGLPYADAKDLAIQTVLGACHMLVETGQHPAVLRDQVTSAGGTTIHGLYALEQGQLKGTIMTGVLNATKRAGELAEQAKHVHVQAKL